MIFRRLVQLAMYLLSLGLGWVCLMCVVLLLSVNNAPADATFWVVAWIAVTGLGAVGCIWFGTSYGSHEPPPDSGDRSDLLLQLYRREQLAARPPRPDERNEYDGCTDAQLLDVAGHIHPERAAAKLQQLHDAIKRRVEQRLPPSS